MRWFLGAAIALSSLVPSIAAAAKCSDDLANTIADDGTTTQCEPYRCDPLTGNCRSVCETQSDCVAQTICDGATRTCRTTKRCSADGLSAIDPSGVSTSCAPYRCSQGMCPAVCATDSDCAASTLKCIASRCSTPSTDDDDGGCSYGHSSTGSFLLVLATLGVLRSRR